jgi:hypothetical protein
MRSTVESFKGNAPASDSDIQAFEAESGIKLPPEYVLILKRMNGGCGFVGANYLDMYPVEKLIEYNRGYGANKYAPELFLFGSNGGGEGFAFDRRQPDWPVVMVPFIPLDIHEAVMVASNIAVFFDTLSGRDLAAPK